MEELITQIIKELGPTGTLICGLAFLIYRPVREISASIKQINHNSTEIVSLLKKRIKKRN